MYIVVIMTLWVILPVCFATCVLVLWFAIWIKYCKIYLRDIPGPTPVPIIGNALQTGTPQHNVLQKVFKLRNKYGPIAKAMLAFKPVLFINDHEWIKFFVTSNTVLKKIFIINYLDSWLGSGLLTDDGPIWRPHRKLITPAFHFKILEQYVDNLIAVSQKFVDKLKDLGNESINIAEYSRLATLDAICETAMGINMNALGDENAAYVHAARRMTEIMMERTFSPMQQYKPMYYLTKNYYEERQCLKILREYTMSVIKTRRAEFDLNVDKGNIKMEDGTKRKLAFLDLLLKSSYDGASVTDEDICDEVNTVMLAGHDTISNAINFGLFCLSKYTDVQQKVFDEQMSIFGADDKHRDTTSADLGEMKYMELFIKELLRLYPVVPMIGRELDEDLEFDTYTLPKGLSIVISIYNLHRDPQFFENPDQFEPERFLNDRQVKFPFSYMPFSAGPRNCIGQRFAMMELKCMLSKIIRQFEVLRVEGFEPKLCSEASLVSSNGVWVKLRDRVWK